MLPSEHVPLQDDVVIHWNNEQVPFIEATHDDDLAVALGMVHAHLRLGQMEIMRRLSQGRLSESIGPIALDFDHVLRILNFGRAVPEILDLMPADTRRWLERFVDGINHYLQQARELPHEFAILGLARAPWSVADIVTIGRLVAADVNWVVWFQLLKLRRRRDWPQLWRHLSDRDAACPPGSGGAPGSEAYLIDALGLSAHWASNSIAVSKARSATGSALIANDPHLGIHLPGPWFIAGLKSPNHHAVGLMAPALPFIALGRNRWIAWGGTNLHAASSDFYDIGDLEAGEITERSERIKVRWWPDRTVKVRETPLGPIVSDARILGLDPKKPIALRWMGHRPSDEFTAMLKLNQARNWQDFRSAIDGLAVPGQFMTYADVDGQVGRAMAVCLPTRRQPRLERLVLNSGQTSHWHRLVTGSDLPTEFDPKDGIVVSANERPAIADVVIGYFFSPPDRRRRLLQLTNAQSQISVDSLAAAINDVYGKTSDALGRHFVKMLRHEHAASEEKAGDRDATRRFARDREHQLLTSLAAWDGHYHATSRGALAFELVLNYFVKGYLANSQVRAYWSAWKPRSVLLSEIAGGDPGPILLALRRAIRQSSRAFRRYMDWGGMHRLRLAHPFGQVPMFGGRYRFYDVAADGGCETVYQTAHRLTSQRHAIVFGAGARHISDLSDPDKNDFVLLGGQDGWLGAENYVDQVRLWQRGAYIRVPLEPGSIRAQFAHRTQLSAPVREPGARNRDV